MSGQAQHNLPRQMTSFVGRESEMADIVGLLEDPNCQLLTLVGPGGVGKSRLAVEIARSKLDDFPDGVWYVSLAPLTAADQLPATIAHALQVSPAPDSQSSLRQELLDFLRDREMLLVLDNFEHLLEEVELVSEMLVAASEVKVLVTSRTVMNLLAEWVQPVSGMRYPQRAESRSLDEFSAVQLFAERARQVQPDFDLAVVSDCVIHICQLLDGVPLGIELAAAWLRTLPCATIAEQIERGLDFLASDRRDVPERHRSMRAVCDHTWGLLSEEEQQAFQRFSVFRGGCALEAAEAVMGATLGVLASLVEKSLLTLGSDRRYQSHELLRQYAEEKLEADAGAMNATRHAHSAYYARFMAELDPKIKGENQIEALDTIEPDFENVRAAWLWALEWRDYAAIDGMLEVLHLFCGARSRFEDSYALFAQAWDKLAPADDESPHRVWGRVLARSHHVDLMPVEAIKYRQEQALAIARQFDDQIEIATCLYWLGQFCTSVHDFSSAIVHLEECLTLLRLLGERFWRARALNELAIVHIQDAQPAEAIPYSQEALGLRREIGDHHGVGWCLHDLGMACYFLGLLDQAERYWRESLRKFQEVGSPYAQTSVLLHLRDMRFWNGDFEGVRSLNESIISANTGQGHAYLLRVIHLLPGVAAGLEGDYEECQTRCESLRDTGSFYGSLGLAVAACGLMDWVAAREQLRIMLRGVRRSYGSLLNWQLLCLPIASLVLNHVGELEQVAALLGLTFSLPPHRNGWVKRWSLIADLADDLEAELGQDTYAAAWERGQTLNLDEVIVSLRAGFGVDVDAQQEANAALDEPLTPRELEVLTLIYAGHNNREIADELVLAESTVKRHINHIYSKLAVESRTQALARARELGLL